MLDRRRPTGPFSPYGDALSGRGGLTRNELQRSGGLRRTSGGSWMELAVFFLMIGGVYLVLAVFDSSLAGQSGRLIGAYLRETWGGAAFIPLLFWVYLCSARLIHVRVPRPLGQLLGTAQLYLSFAFILGLARHAGWNSGWAAFDPGRVGMELARFFVLNFGALGTILVAVASFLLAAFLFRSRLLMRLLFSANQAAGTRRRQPAEKKARDREDAAASQRAERAVFIPPMPSYPAEKPAEEEEARLVRRSSTGDSLPFDLAPIVETEEPKSAPTESPVEPPKPPLDPEPEPELLQEREPVPEPLPVLSPEPAPRPEPEREPEPAPVPDIPVRAAEAPQKSAVEILDDLLASLKAGAFSPPEELLAPLEDELPHSVSSPSRAEPRTRRTATETVPDRERKEAGMTEPQEEFAENEEEDAGALPRGETAFPPPLDLFGPPVEDRGDKEALEAAKGQGEVIIETLKDFGVNASVAHIVVGPSVVQFQLDLAPGTKVNKVSSLANELTMALAVVSVRVEAPIPGAHYVGIEIPNSHRRGIPLRMALESEEMEDCKALLPLPMGMKVDSHFLVRGLEDMPHLLVAGTTGSGKSVFVNACILGMCSRRTPDELKLILVDPKHVEFAIYEGLPHLLALPISDPRKAIDALAWAVQEMEARMESFARAHVRNLASYNARVLPKNRRPSIVVVVDELADLMYTAGKEVEGLIVRLAQKARAAGIHLILATQRPSVDVITGLIKANVPARVAFAVPSQTDSRTILDASGADKLLGKGDMLFLGTGAPGPVRLQSPFVTEEQTLDFVEYLKSSFGEPEYIEFAETAAGSGGEGGRPGNGIVNDPKMEEAIRAVMEMGIASASGLQRLLSIGYPKAGRLITAMEQLGILGPQTPNSSKPRDILMDEEEAYEALERARSGEGFDGD